VSADGRRIHPLAVVVGAVIAANIVVAGIDRLAGGTEGPRSSSYATAPEGLAAYADLLARSNHPVTRLRSPLDEDPPPPATTVVVLDPPGLSQAEARALGDFLAAGGRLVVGGRGPHPWLSEILPDAPAWTGGGVHEAGMLAPASEVAGLTAVRAGAEGYWSESGATLPALGRGAKSIVNVAAAGRGRAVLLADATILHNRNLARAENAALGLRIAGEAGRPVTFVESVHGYGAASGLGALPTSWRAAGVIGMVAALVLLWARGRRLGPPEDEARPLPPPRRDYVVALAGALARTRRPAEALAPLQDSARRRLARSAGLAPDADETALRAAAAARGVPEGLTSALFRRPTSDTDVLSVGRAAALLRHGAPEGAER
jgi:Domain of unknown function (DUF4350)